MSVVCTSFQHFILEHFMIGSCLVSHNFIACVLSAHVKLLICSDFILN